jgi:hypothetical protein
VFAQLREWLAYVRPDQLANFAVCKSHFFKKPDALAQYGILFLSHLALNKLVLKNQFFALSRLPKFLVLPAPVGAH